MSSTTSSPGALFEICAKTPKGGRAGMYATAVCSCGAEEDVFARASVGGSVLPAEPLAKKFRKLGWEIGTRKGKHTCPKCKAVAVRLKTALKTAPGTVVAEAPVRADPPPQPKPDDRRGILEALEIVFCPENGFDDGYDDKRVAAEKGVPRRWVEDIREAFFGPIPAPKVDHAALFAAAMGRMSACLKELAEVEKRALEARVAAESVLAEILQHANELNGASK